MLAAALIVFREVFEAGLILGLVAGATPGVPGRGRWLAGGVAAGLAGACLLAVFAGAIGDALEGVGQDVLNAGVLGVAAAMLGWHTIWMARHGREMATELRAVGQAVAEGRRTLLALAVVVAVAVLREGSEVVLFLYGLVAGGDGWWALGAGAGAGLLGGAAAAALLYRGLLAVPARHVFGVSNALLSLLAAGMAAQSAGFLVSADLLPALGARVWDTSAVLDQRSLVGRALHALVGYADRPAGVQVLVYAAVLGTLWLAGRRFAVPAPRGHAA